MSKVEISKQLLTDFPKYNNPQKIDGIQQHPNEMKTINFKQDYVVIIRKKLYYAISQNDEEQYIRVYQINNFTNLSTSHNVYGRPGTCDVTIKGAERVICAERDQQDLKGWQSWQQLLSGWINLNEGDANNPWTKGKADWALKDADGLDLKNLLKAREAKYGWKFAEKCDFEPMDEIYIFGKTRNKLYKDKDGMYPFKPIFFGYINKVMKTYTAGNSKGLLLTINASDQLKILQYSRISNAPTKMPGVLANGGYDIQYNLDKDSLGYFKLNDNFYEDTTKNNTPYMYTNVFAGKYPYEIITQLALDAGVPKKFLDTRIEKIKKVPFVMQITDKNIELLQANAVSRLDFCTQAASKLFVEFFCDEEGNLVLKIPSYSLGANRLPANNMGNTYDQSIYDSLDNPLQNNDFADIIKSNIGTGISSELNTNRVNSGSSSIVAPSILWKGPAHSSNYSQGRNLDPDLHICAIVDHITTGTAESALDWFQQQHPSEDGPSSAHYIVTKSGEIWQVVKDEDTAYHTGIDESKDGIPTAQLYFEMGKINPNRYTIGIEHENIKGEPLTDLQYKATLQLHSYLCSKHSIPISPHNILGHSDLNTINRPNDPGPNFPWANLLRDLNAGFSNSTSGTITQSIDYRSLILKSAREKLGYPYIRGGQGPDNFDCSGFVYWCLNQAGLTIERKTVSGYFDKSKSINKEDLKTGDLAFYNPQSGDSPHMGICINEDGELRWIHASTSQTGVIEEPDSNFQTTYKWTHYGNIIDVISPSSVSSGVTNNAVIESTKNNIIRTTPMMTFFDNQKVILKRIIYEVKSGDSLLSISQKYLKSDQWNEIYMDNQETIGNDPNLIQSGQKLLIYSRDSSDESQNVKAQEMRNSDSNTTLSQKLNSNENTDSTLGVTNSQGKTLSEQTDQDIPVIPPEDIISFTITDSDEELYNMYEVQIETNILETSSFPVQTVRRVSPDFNSIVRFGMRPAPGVISTPLINSVVGAQLFGTMMLCTSMAKRVTGALSMIEDSAIKIGDPIRFHTYDEHPYKETTKFKNYKNQSIFYVDSIQRTIDVTNISTMTLTLKAGRMMGQESMFDQMLLLYRYYFDEMPLLNDYIDTSKLKTFEYTVQASDTWQNIMKNTYKFDPTINTTRFTSIVQTIIKLNPEIFGTTTNAYSMLNESLIAGNVLIFPDPSHYITATPSSSSTGATSYSGSFEAALDRQLAPGMLQFPTESTTRATREEVAQYLNPDTYLTGVYKYQFLVLSGTNGIDEETLNNFLSGKGVLENKGSVFLQAARENDISEVYLAGHSSQETGNGTSPLATGTCSGNEGFYNVFGWAAYDDNPNKHGSDSARKSGWDTIDKAILGGAKLIANNYIHGPDNQNTVYKMKWNPTGSDPTHEYATDITWATQKAVIIKGMFDQFPGATLTFDITTYDNSVSSASSGSNPESVAGSGINYSNAGVIGWNGNIQSFDQYDSAWANVPYAGKTLSSSGCSATCAAIIIASLHSSMPITPVTAANFATDHSSEVKSLDWLEAYANYYGNTMTSYGQSSIAQVKSELQKGDCLVIALMDVGHFTSGGHFIVLTGYTNDGYIKVQDPIANNRNNYRKGKDYDSVFRNDRGNGQIEVKENIITSEVKDDGQGSFWVIR